MARAEKMRLRRIGQNGSGRGSAWLERLVRDQEVGGSNPLAPTKSLNNLRFWAGRNSSDVHADVHAGALLDPLSGGDGCFLRDIRLDRVHCLQFRVPADVAVVFEHRAVEMASNAHNGLV